MLMSLPHNGENPDESHTIFLGVWMWSCTPTGDPDPIFGSCLDNQDGRRGDASIVPQELKALENKSLQAQQQINLYQA